MYINSIISYLGAWKKLVNENGQIVREVEAALLTLADHAQLMKVSSDIARRGRGLYDFRSMGRNFSKKLNDFGWETNVRVFPEGRRMYRSVEIDAVKDYVGLEMIFGKWFFIESLLFTRFPLFVRAKKLRSGVALVPMKSLANSMSVGIAYFELMRDVLEPVPVALKYPFAIVGYSAERTECTVINLTTEIDEFLVEQIGNTLDEIILAHEMHNYDFKAKFTGGERFNETVCAFSNLPDGGMFLFGIADDGEIVGLPKGKRLDSIKIGIGNVINNGKYQPPPRFSFHIFDSPTDPDLCIFIMRVLASEVKPSTYDGRVYVRYGPSTQVATPAEIRRLVLG